MLRGENKTSIPCFQGGVLGDIDGRGPQLGPRVIPGIHGVVI